MHQSPLTKTEYDEILFDSIEKIRNAVPIKKSIKQKTVVQAFSEEKPIQAKVPLKEEKMKEIKKEEFAVEIKVKIQTKPQP